ncbi:AAA family ATPase [Virgibacillus phasianinus]|uniref:AAA family ATPase n=1 Tax=Virgibacillus phasianinus TaxID=2017483 RepID=UPI0015609090|nr:AAA family ATPase [Virgibacillus phasianinus]
MNKINIVLLTKDINYANYFSNFMMNPNNDDKFLSKIFTDPETFKANTRNKKQHILLTDIEIPDDDILAFDRVIILSEDQHTYSNESLTIYKYQPLKELLSQVLAIYYEANGKLNPIVNNKEKEQVVSFYSGSGGVGKTLFSLCLAKHLAIQSKRVFYLNLEELHTTNLYFKQEKPSSAEVFYYLRNNKEQLVGKIESLKSRDSLTNIDYFSLPILPEEMQQSTEEDIATLIQALRETQNYDYIIIDLDCSIHERNVTALGNSDEIIWLLSTDETSFTRTQNIFNNDLLDLGEDRSKIHFVLNKVSDTLFDGFNGFNFSIETHIPFNSRWLQLSEEAKMQEDTHVGEQLHKLLKEFNATEVSILGS